MPADTREALARALEEHRAGRLDAARRLYDEILARDAENADALNLRGVVAHQLGRSDEALGFIARAVRRRPRVSEFHLNAGHVLLGARRNTDAIAAYRQAIRYGGDTADAHNNIGVALMHLGRLREAEAAFRDALERDATHADAWNNLGGMLLSAGDHPAAESAFRRALELNPNDTSAAANLRRLRAALAPVWHFQMMNDAPRNAAYAEAIASVVRPGDRVLEIGTGSGLLAMLAARAGAAEVVTCEAQPAVADVAREIIAANGLNDRISVWSGHSSGLAAGDTGWAPADVLIAEVFDAALLGERALAAISDARARLLKPEAPVVPAAARLVGRCVESDDLAAMASVGEVAGFDLSAFNAFAPHAFQCRLGSEARYAFLGEPFEVFSFDFVRGDLGPSRRRIDVPLVRSGRVDAVVVWFELELGGGIRMSTEPGAPRSHWPQSVHALPGGRRVRQGDRLALECTHDMRSLTVRAVEGVTGLA